MFWSECTIFSCAVRGKEQTSLILVLCALSSPCSHNLQIILAALAFSLCLKLAYCAELLFSSELKDVVCALHDAVVDFCCSFVRFIFFARLL